MQWDLDLTKLHSKRLGIFSGYSKAIYTRVEAINNAEFGAETKVKNVKQLLNYDKTKQNEHSRELPKIIPLPLLSYASSSLKMWLYIKHAQASHIHLRDFFHEVQAKGTLGNQKLLFQCQTLGLRLPSHPETKVTLSKKRTIELLGTQKIVKVNSLPFCHLKLE